MQIILPMLLILVLLLTKRYGGMWIYLVPLLVLTQLKWALPSYFTSLGFPNFQNAAGDAGATG